MAALTSVKAPEDIAYFAADSAELDTVNVKCFCSRDYGKYISCFIETGQPAASKLAKAMGGDVIGDKLVNFIVAIPPDFACKGRREADGNQRSLPLPALLQQAGNPFGGVTPAERAFNNGRPGCPATQNFYNPESYFRFVDDCEKLGLDLPIVPGIMPITNFTQLARFSDNCGAEIPRWIRKRLEGFSEDRDAIRAFGLDVVTDLCQRLLAGGAPGLHFYTMNQAGTTMAIGERLGLITD